MFRWEKDLVQAFELVSEKFLTDILQDIPEHSFFLEEFDSTYGVADIVLGTYAKKPELNRPPLDVNWIAPLRSWGDGDIVTSKDFIERFSVSGSTASRKIREYIDAYFWEPVSHGKYKAIKRYDLLTDFVIAIEAKLKNWKRAIIQARCYRRYSNYSFVLLDEAYARPAIKSIDMFKRANVGLITMSSKDSYIIHWTPEYKDTSENFHYLRLNETLYQDSITISS